MFDFKKPKTPPRHAIITKWKVEEGKQDISMPKETKATCILV